MRIGIDARETLGHPTGVGRYLVEIIRHWSTLPEAASHQFILYRPAEEGADRPIAGTGSLALTYRTAGRGSGSWWEQVTLPIALRGDGLDILFAPGYTAPIRTSTPVALTIHDLSFLAHPEWFTPRERIRRAWLTRLSARRARVILTVSAFSRREIEKHLGIPGDRIQVIPHGLSERFAGDGAGDERAPTSRRARDGRAALILFVGSVFNRRHLPDLIRAFAGLAIAHPDATLEVVGENRTWPHQDLQAIAKSAGVSDRVVIRSYVTEATLEYLYRRADVFAFLSEYEGFGLTPLEALGRGVPVVVLDTEVAHEVYGPAAVYVGAGDIAATTAALASMVDDQAARRAVMREVPAVLGRYRWDAAAKLTLDAIVSAAGKQAGG